MEYFAGLDVSLRSYITLGKSDAIDVEATCKAATRQTMSFVAIKNN